MNVGVGRGLLNRNTNPNPEKVAIPVKPLFSEFLDVFNASHMPTLFMRSPGTVGSAWGKT